MLHLYKTMKTSGENEIIISKSRFIGHVARAETEEIAMDFIQKIKKQHWNATHNCSAYLIGDKDQIQKAQDDGEPSGTAGVPMLDVLKKKQLKDTVVVVTRYFGGIKLGAGGLVRAYSKATSEAIDTIGVVTRQLMRVMHVVVDYTWLGKIENELRSSIYEIKQINYVENVEFEVYVDELDKINFQNWVIELTNAQAKMNEGDLIYMEKDFLS